MQTAALIQTLREDARTRAAPRLLSAPWIVLSCALSAGALFWLFYGPRPDLLAELARPGFLLKPAIMLLVIGFSFAAVRAVARPGSTGGAGTYGLLVPAVLLGLALLAETFLAPDRPMAMRLDAGNAVVCLSAIPLLGLTPLILLLAATRRGATTHPRLAGALCGLSAAGVGAFFYAAHCPNDSVLFVAAWYPPAAAILVLLGILAGPRVLRW